MIKTISQIAKEIKRTPQRVYQIVDASLLRDVHYYRSNGTILVNEAGQDEIKRILKEHKKVGRKRKVKVLA